MSSAALAPSLPLADSALEREAILARWQERQRHARRRRRLVVWIARAAILAAVLGTWQWYGSRSDYWDFVIGTPTRTWSRLWGWRDDGDWWSDVWLTVQEAGLGFVLGVILAVALVGIVTPLPLLYRFLSPFLAALNALPKIVLAPLFIIWFGLAMKGKVYFVTAAIFFVIFYGVHGGIRTIDRTLIDNARMLGASRLQLIRTVDLPAVATWLLVSLRISAAMSLLAAVVAEYLGSQGGIGNRIAAGRAALRVDIVLAGIVFVAAIAVILDRVLVRIQRRFEKWRVF